ncbi:MAG TPA: thiol-disulfide oxidoreductase DCC family protein [Roseiflexaceae bacterium]|nr:thiol-disulfide oxidoreductase DCC family protein [Roseiflexaceae bacterium]
MEHPIILFDGVCNLCQRSVRFIIERDERGLFRFASLQSATGRRLLAEHGLETPDEPESIVLIEGGQATTASTAALRIARRLRGAWPLLYALVVVPRPLRDAVYRFVARHRYRWFGRQETCMVPSPALRARFLDAGEGLDPNAER